MYVCSKKNLYTCDGTRPISVSFCLHEHTTRARTTGTRYRVTKHGVFTCKNGTEPRAAWRLRGPRQEHAMSHKTSIPLLYLYVFYRRSCTSDKRVFTSAHECAYYFTICWSTKADIWHVKLKTTTVNKKKKKRSFLFSSPSTSIATLLHILNFQTFFSRFVGQLLFYGNGT